MMDGSKFDDALTGEQKFGISTLILAPNTLQHTGF